MKKDLKYYLSLPYKIEVIPIPESEGGGYAAQLPELGKYAIVGDGDTPEEAIRDLNEVKERRFKGYLEKGFQIPEPKDERDEFSGKFVLRLPKELHRLLAYSAHENQTSLNSYLIYLLSSNYQFNKTQDQFKVLMNRIDIMTDIMWNIDFEISPDIPEQPIDEKIAEEMEHHPFAEYSEFKRAA